MIPKIIHLVWLGTKPKYLDNVIAAYKDYNPEFSINLYHIEDIHQSNDMVFNYAIDVLL